MSCHFRSAAPIFAALLTALPAVVIPAAPIPVEAKRIQPVYHPTELGTRWVYAAGPGPVEVIVEVTSIEEKNGVKTITAHRIEDGEQGRVWQTVRISRDGMFVSDDGGIASDPPPCLLRSPAKAGEQWSEEFNFGKRRCTGKRSVGAAEEIEVPAGRFTAVPVTFDYKLADCGDERDTTWYAPNVGEVKSVFGRSERVLKSFRKGK